MTKTLDWQHKMKLQLASSKVTELNLVERSKLENSLDIDDIDDFSFDFEPFYPENNFEEFSILFKIRVKVKDTHFLFLTYQSNFKVSEEKLNDTFKSSHFPYVNAPAIAFPYLRAFVSTFLLNAGFEPIMLPSINFSAMHKESIS